MKTLIDISPALRVGMGVFPGDAAFAVSQTFTIGPDCPVNVASIAMSTHCGAHADAPLHYDPAGASIDMLDLADFIGPARVIDARGTDALCGFDEIASALDGAPPRLLFKLMDRGDQLAWPTGFRALAPETVERLALRGTRLIGVDVPSVDPETSKSPAVTYGLQAVRSSNCRESCAGRRRARRLRIDSAAVETERSRRGAGARGAQAIRSPMRWWWQIDIAKTCRFPLCSVR